MTFPQRHHPGNNFSRDEALGLTERGEKLDGEFRAISEILNQINSFVRQFTTSDAKLQLDQAVRIRDVIDIQLFDGDGVQDTFTFAQPIDSAVDLVRTFVDGVRVDPTGYTDTEVVLPAPATPGVENVDVRIYTNMAGVLDRMQDLVASGGAAFIGYDDAEGRYIADNVRDALTEAMRDHDDLVTALGDIAGYVLRDGTRTMTGQWDINEDTDVIITPVTATGTLTVSTLPLDTELLTLSDGITTLSFEWDDDATTTVGNTPVDIGVDNLVSGESLIVAINNAPLAITATGIANGADFDITLTHQVPGQVGNIPIVTTGGWASAETGMAGGIDGSFSGMLKTYYRLRLMPRSLKNGDAVVHEQLADIIAQVQAIIAAFLRIDGANQMVNNLPMGGNKVVDMADGTEPTHGATVKQVTVVSDQLTAFIPKLGAQHPTRGGQSQNLGSLSFNNVATLDASDPQDAAAEVKTLSGVARPTAPHHVVNLQKLDEIQAILQGQINAVDVGGGAGGNAPDGSVTLGVSLGGCVLDGEGLGSPVADLNAGGIFHFDGPTLSITVDQLPIEDTFIFVTGDVSITADFIMPLFKLQISCTGTMTISAAATLTCHDLVLRGGLGVEYAGHIAAHGNILNPVIGQNDFNFQPGGGLAGFVNISSDGACNMQGGSTIATAVCSITAAESSVMDVTIDADIVGGEGFVLDLGAGGNAAPCPATFGIAFGFMAATLNHNMMSVGNSQSSDHDWIQSRRTYFAYIPSPYAGQGAVNVCLNSVSNDSIGGAGGAGGTNGGKGGNGEGSAQPGLPRAVGSHRRYLFPLGPGGAGAGIPSIQGGRGGGVISIYVVGDLDLSSAILNANGANGGGNAGTDAAGAGGGGAIRAVATGTITNGTANANGGDVPVANKKGGSGGGGGINFVASIFAGIQTLSAIAGVGQQGGGSSYGDDGHTATNVLTEADIVCLAAEGYWR